MINSAIPDCRFIQTLPIDPLPKSVTYYASTDDDYGWLMLAASAFDFWDNERDSVFDEMEREMEVTDEKTGCDKRVIFSEQLAKAIEATAGCAPDFEPLEERKLLAERDEARAWARRYKREAEELRFLLERAALICAEYHADKEEDAFYREWGRHPSPPPVPPREKI